jgi:hypothetical protein
MNISFDACPNSAGINVFGANCQKPKMNVSQKDRLIRSYRFD